MSTGHIRGIFNEVAGTRPTPSQPSDVATRSSENTIVTSSNTSEDSPTNMSSTARDGLAAQSSAGSVTSSETMSLPPADHGEPPSTRTGAASRRPLPPTPAAPAAPLGGDPEQGVLAGEAEEGGEHEAPQAGGRAKCQNRPLLAWLGVVCVTVALDAVLCAAVLLGLYGDKRFAVSPADMRTQGQSFAAFCSDLNVSGSVPFSAYLLDHPATIDPHNRFLYSAQQSIQLCGWRNSVHVDYYLLPGSNVTIYTCLHTAGCVDLLVFKGESDYDAWRDEECPTCYEAAARLTTKDCWSFSYVAPDLDTYYFVYTSCQDGQTNYTAHVYVNRSVYDVSDARYAWVNTTECVVQPAWDVDSWLVWQTAAFAPSGPDVKNFVSTSCRYRLAMVLVVFGLVPVLLITLSGVVISLCCRGPLAPRVDANLELRGPPPYALEENTPLLGREEAAKPPDYNDLAHFSYPPPSYDEAQGLLRS